MTKTITAIAIAVLSMASFAAAAQTADVKCETRSGRSKASVDGKNLSPGQYSAVLLSGSNVAQSPYEAAVAGEAEFDFDSNRRDINQGATAISSTFIRNNRVTGQILDANGNIVASSKVTCRAR